MNNFKILTEQSPFFIFFCVLAGAAYAFLLYSRKSSWSQQLNYLLAALRGILVALLTFLLLGPFIKYFKNNLEKPSVVIAIDNSSSITLAKDSLIINKFRNNIYSLVADKKPSEVDLEVRILDRAIPPDQVQDLKFNAPVTNLSEMLQDIQEDYTNRNLAGIVLATDGIYNEGISPGFLALNAPVYTIGMGDTVPQKDINLKSLAYNRITYTGNKFPIVAEIHNTGFANEKLFILLKQNNKIIERKTLQLRSDKGINEVTFSINSDKSGLQHYVVEVENIAGEFTLDNNRSHAYVEIIEGKEKILLVAAAPHPDIKAIRSAIEKKKNYEITVLIPGIGEYKPDKYDLIIYHQLPDNFGSFKDLKNKLLKDGVPSLFILGSQTNINSYNLENKLVNIGGRLGQMDNVEAAVNTRFDKFKLDDGDIKMVSSYPPVSVPFGNYETSPAAEILFYQQVGSVVTDKPVVVVSKSTPKTASIIADGIWQWQLQEYRETKETKTFDKVITNLIQYLSAKEDKRKFRSFPIADEFSIHEPVFFETEVYNDIYEKIYGQQIDLKIQDETGNEKVYNFATGETSPRFEVKGLSEGLHKYVASTTLSGKKEKVSGEFYIKDINLEAISTTANHELLRTLASKTGGKFYALDNMEAITKELNEKKFKSIIHSSEEYNELINIPWLFFIFIFLISIEWFIRKYKGSY